MLNYYIPKMVVVVMTEEIMECQNLFWQYPAITEKTFYEQNKTNENFIGFPWATMIDKRIHPKTIIDMLRIFINPNINYYTCCQHIHFRQLVPLFKLLNINCVFSPHKLKGEEQINDVFIKPCPLYAVNLEDPLRNREFKNANLLEIERPLLYSFHGAYNPKVYLTDVRKRLFEMEHPDNTSVKNIGGWFYESVVYSDKQNKNGELNETKEQKESTQSYNKLLLNSRFSLCPSGSGPNSIRFWESLGSGAIPILLSYSLELPEHELWDEAIIRVLEKDVEKIPQMLSEITYEQEEKMRKNCLNVYECFKNEFIKKKSKCFKVRIPNEMIKPYFGVFGHFYLDHLFQLYKIKNWYNATNHQQIDTIFIENYKSLKLVAPFIDFFYNRLFKNVLTDNIYNYNVIDFGVIMGSKIESESSNIYLARSMIPLEIPSNVILNGRKITKENKTSLQNMAKLIKTTSNERLFNSDNILIINREKSPRRLINLEELITKLEMHGKKCHVVTFDNMKLSEQIKTISSYQRVISACGSVQVHISFLPKTAVYIELCESGFRYPNTVIYGNYFDINTFSLCSPLKKNLNNIRNRNDITKRFFNSGDKMSNLITTNDVDREKEYYSKLMEIDCFNIHMIQDIDCLDYIDLIVNHI